MALGLLGSLIAKSSAKKLAVGAAKSTAKTAGKRVIASGGKSVSLNVGKTAGKIGKKTAKRKTKLIVKASFNKKDTLGKFGRAIIKNYNSFQEGKQYYYVAKQMASGDLNPEKVAYYMRNYFMKQRGLRERDKNMVKEALEAFNYDQDLDSDGAGDNNEHNSSSTAANIKTFVASSWQYFGELYINKDDYLSNNSSGIMTIYLIPETTGGKGPFLHTGVTPDIFNEWKNAASVGQYWWYALRTGDYRTAQHFSTTYDQLIDWMDNNPKFKAPKDMKEYLDKIKDNRDNISAPQQFSRKYTQQTIASLGEVADIKMPQKLIDKMMIETVPSKVNGATWHSIKRQNTKLANNFMKHYGIDLSPITETFNSLPNQLTKAVFDPKKPNAHITALNNVDTLMKESFRQSKDAFIEANKQNFIEKKLDNGRLSYTWNKNKVMGSVKKFIK